MRAIRIFGLVASEAMLPTRPDQAEVAKLAGAGVAAK
jgi:hypothetical protein